MKQLEKGDRVLVFSGRALAYFSEVQADYLVVHDTAHPDLVVIEGHDGLWRQSDFVLAPEQAGPFRPGDRVTANSGSNYHGLPGTVTACKPHTDLVGGWGVWITWDLDGKNFRYPCTQILPWQETLAPSPAAAKAPPAESEHARRKARPLARGLVYYFPDALRLVSAAIASDGQIPFPAQISALVAEGHRESVALLVLTGLQLHLTGRVAQRGTEMWGTFREALLEVAAVSVVGNGQHHPGAPLHWEKDKSRDHADCILRHWADHQAGSVVDSDGLLHLAKAAWRALAWLQVHLERLDPDLAKARDALRAACASGTEL